MPFSALYVGATGMIAHGEDMSVIGHNIANVNTTAYKSSNTIFEDLVSQTVTSDTSTNVGISQSGKGVGVSAILTDFDQGSLETTTNQLDMAINGNGFFQVELNGEEYYTRAGNFRFDVDGYLVDPTGYRLQGQQATDAGWSITQDIILEANADGNYTIDPQATSSVTLISNLGDSYDNSENTDNPYFAMAQAWDGTQETPLADDAYTYSQQITVYDDAGDAHTLTVYYDGITQSNASDQQYWEYIVTMDPAEDGRSATTEEGSGLLMMGTMTFSATGELSAMSAYTLSDGVSGVSTDLGDWVPSGFSEDGYPEFSATFLDDSGTAHTQDIALNFGLNNPSGTWRNGNTNAAALTSYLVPGLPTANYQATAADAGGYSFDLSILSQATDNTTGSTDPYFSLLQAYDGTADTPLADGTYAYSETIQITDDDGNPRYVTVYYDAVGGESEEGVQYWEFVVAQDPDLDTRSSNAGTGSGLLMSGVLGLDSEGNLVEQATYTLTNDANPTTNLGDWTTSGFSADGLAQTSASFFNEGSNASPSTASLAFNWGLAATDGAWTSGNGESAADVGTGDVVSASVSDLPNFAAETESMIMTAYNGTGSTTYTDQDGYPTGYLNGMYVTDEGVLTGTFSNGEEADLWKIPLYYFTNEYGLRSEGGNHYSATAEAGQVFEATAGDEGVGTISGSSLETSNVDLATEFVGMIMTQRGFQANSKIITTSDEMLQKAIELKR